MVFRWTWARDVARDRRGQLLQRLTAILESCGIEVATSTFVNGQCVVARDVGEAHFEIADAVSEVLGPAAGVVRWKTRERG